MRERKRNKEQKRRKFTRKKRSGHTLISRLSDRWFTALNGIGDGKRQIEENCKNDGDAVERIGRLSDAQTLVWSGDAATTACCCRTVDFSTKILVICVKRSRFSLFFSLLCSRLLLSHSLFLLWHSFLFLSLVCAMSFFLFFIFLQLLIWCHVCLLLPCKHTHTHTYTYSNRKKDMNRDRDIVRE